MNNGELRRSKRGNQGVPPVRFGSPVWTTHRARNVRGREEQQASTQNHLVVASRANSVDDVRSIRTQSSTTSNIRRRQRESEIRAAEELARIENEREALGVEQRRLEREADIVRLRQQNEAANLEELSEISDLEEGEVWDTISLDQDRVRVEEDYRARDNEDYRAGDNEDYRAADNEDYRAGDNEDYRAGVNEDYRAGVNEDYRAGVEEDYREEYHAARGPMEYRVAESATQNFGNATQRYELEPRQQSLRNPFLVGSQSLGNPFLSQLDHRNTGPNYQVHPRQEQDNHSLNDGFGKLAEVLVKALEQPRQKVAEDKHYMARQTFGKMKLPDFEGDPMEWPTFIAQFTSSSEECNFSPAENLVRLRNCLKKKARDCVKALLVSPDNLEEILETLQSNFGRKDQIIWSLIENVKKITPPKENDYHSIMEFSNGVRNMCATMKTLKSKVHLQNPQLLRDLVNKLPPNMKYDWGKLVADQEDDELTLEEFSAWIKKTTKALSYTANPLTCDDRNLKEKRRESSYSLDDEKKKCVQCNGVNHKLPECYKFKALDVDSRWKLVNEKRLCYSCLNWGHRASAYRNRKSCDEDNCKRFHHRLLHKANKEEHNSSEEDNNVEESHSVYEIGSSHLPIIPVIVSGPAGTVKTFALLDEGSTASFVDSSLAYELGLDGTPDPLSVNVMNGKADDDTSQRATFKIKGEHDYAKTFAVNGARTVNSLNVGLQSLDFDRLQRKFGYLKGLLVSSYANAKPRILLGQPDKLLSLARKYVHQSKRDPVAYKTSLGWVICGKFSRAGCYEHSFLIQEDDELHKLVKESFSVESFGVSAPAEKPRSNEDKRAEEIMNATTKRIGDEFETGLLWRHDDVKLPDSYNNAFWRLKCQEKKMDKDPEFAKAMSSKIDEYLDKGFISKLNPEDVTKSEKEWYLPFFGVFNPNKPGKMRLVFDAAAKVNGVSLNSKLLQGPDYLNPLPIVLWKFRQRKIAFGADITDMYHRVKIIKEDLPSQRFLWRGMERDKPPEVYQINVMIFGAACSPSSAQYVKNKNALEFMEQLPAACQAIISLFYVDDYLDSCDDDDEAEKIVKDVIEVCKRGGFTICKWVTNSRKVLMTIPSHLRAEGLKELDGTDVDLPTGRTLGVWWDAEKDEFTFKLVLQKVSKRITDGEILPTKRELLRPVMSVFDPLGFIAHLMIKAKILLQDVWRTQTGWDEKISTSLESKWKLWLEELKKIEQIRIPRCYSVLIPKADTIQLHLFCDASELAFAAVAFLRVQYGDTVHTSLVTGKTRVAALKPMSIPRLELQAAVMGSRLAASIRAGLEIKLNETFFWTDSRTVLFWLRSEARNYKQFVSHRLGEILELTEVDSWRWVPTKENVADDATRRNVESDLSCSSRWFNGPSFLKNDATTWPVEEKVEDKPLVEELETKIEFVNYVEEDVIHRLMRDCSTYKKVIRTQAWILRFIDVYMKKLMDCKSPFLSTEELDNAERVVLRCTQMHSFGEDIRRMENGGTLKKKSKLFNLSPFVDSNGLLRMKGGLQNADFLPECAKNPLILDSKDTITKMLIQMHHEDYRHNGRNTVINKIREKFWVIGLTSAVRKCIRESQFCKNRSAQPDVPEMGNLPPARITPYVRPFTFTGMDFFGPYDVIIGRRHEKLYGVLFTCLTTRAVHIEKADSLSTDSCIMAIDRFVAEREKPQEIFCDNGTNFRGAERELERHVTNLDAQKISLKMSCAGMKWNFNPPGAPHMGGCWERLVRSIKTAMGNAVKMPVRDEVLLTLFKQASYVVNSRPLTEVSVEPDEPVVLTPNHFLIGPNFNVDSLHEMEQMEEFADDDLRVRRQWRITQRLVDQFWTRWIKEYLPTLTRRTRWFGTSRKLQVGDICIVVDPNLPRNTWPLGRIVAVQPGKDGHVRVADVMILGKVYR